MSRPICVHCGESYGRRATTSEKVEWIEGESKPEYRGNGIVVKERFHTRSMSRATVEELRAKWVPNNWDREMPRHLRPAFVADKNVAFREIWDGESWLGGYDPFCTLRCALDYARKAYARSQVSRNTGRTYMVGDYLTDDGKSAFDSVEKLVKHKLD